MLRRHQQIRMQIQQLLDACLFAVSFWLAYVIRSSPLAIHLFGLQPVAPFETFVSFYLVLIPVVPLVLESQGFYNRSMVAPRRTIFWPLLRGCFLVALGLTLLLFFFRMYLPRSVIFGFGALSFVTVWLKEEVLRLGFKTKFTQAQLRRRFILMGPAEETARMQAAIQLRPDGSLLVLAELDLTTTPVPRLVELLHEHSANGVIISARHANFEQVEAAIRACEIEGVEAWLVADFFKTQISHTSFDDFYGRPVMVFRTAPEASWAGLVKQVMDFVGAFLLLAVFSLPLLFLALLIRLTSPGPVFFRQQRAGLNGQPFTMYKFRTMVTNAEQLQHELAALNEMSGPVFKVSNDPRVTGMGRFLRKFSLDEFPQLLNVLRGEMSLVGPRPLPVHEVARFDDVAHRRRLSVRPGLTCLWQVRGRNEIADFKDWVRLDLEYIDHWSLWLDITILFRTIPAVFSGTGAK
ncbi:MAG: sugar transferase [Verrucomicrobia bacterium]|nr:sugar transferase [Verrucomicrobiota bacterium]